MDEFEWRKTCVVSILSFFLLRNVEFFSKTFNVLPLKGNFEENIEIKHKFHLFQSSSYKVHSFYCLNNHVTLKVAP